MNLKLDRTMKNLLQAWDKNPKFAWVLSIAGILILGWVTFLWNLGKTGLVDETEPLFAEAARQMVVTGDWITPYFNGDTRFDKPPLIYWLMAIGYKLIGVNELAARLPSALSAIALMILGFYTLRYFGFVNIWEKKNLAIQQELGAENNYPQDNNVDTSITINRQLWLAAILGGIMIGFHPQTIAWGRTGVSDMLLSGCMCSAMLAFFIGYAQESRSLQQRWYLAFYILSALAVLTKGPVGLVLPGVIIGSFLLYLGNWREVVGEMQIVRGIIIFLVIAVPWYILVILANGEAYIESFFGYHNIERFTSVVNNHSAPWYFYFFVVLLGFAPWSIYLPMAIARIRFWKRSHWQRQPRSQQLGLFAIFWFFGIFLFFTIAVTKLPSYVLPLMPAGAILVALLWSEMLTQQQESNRKTNFSLFLQWSEIFNILLWLVAASACFAIRYNPQWIDKDPAMPNLPQVLANTGLIIIGTSITAAIALGCIITLLTHRKYWLWSINFIGLLAFLIFVITPASFLLDSQRQLPLRQISQVIVQVKKPEEELLMIGFEKPSIVFYSHQPVNYFRRTSTAIEYIKASFVKQPQQPSVLILTYPDRLIDLGLKSNQYEAIDVSGTYKLIRVSKQVMAKLSPVLNL